MAQRQQAWVTEMQAEPWEASTADYLAAKSTAPADLRRRFEAIHEQGYPVVLLWGSEYWLARQAAGDPSWPRPPRGWSQPPTKLPAPAPNSLNRLGLLCTQARLASRFQVIEHLVCWLLHRREREVLIPGILPYGFDAVVFCWRCDHFRGRGLQVVDLYRRPGAVGAG